MTITLYTIANSPFCTQARDYLKAKNLPFEEKDVELSKDSLHEMLTISDRFAGVPYAHVVLDDGTEAGLRGFTLQEYDQLFNHAQNSYTPVSTPESAQPVAPVASVSPVSTDNNISMPEEPVTNEAAQVSQPPVGTDVNTYKAEETAVGESQSTQPSSPTQPSSQLGSIMDNLMQHTVQSSPDQSQQIADQNHPTYPTVPSEVPSNDVVTQPNPSNSDIPTEIPKATSAPSMSIPDFPSK